MMVRIQKWHRIIQVLTKTVRGRYRITDASRIESAFRALAGSAILKRGQSGDIDYNNVDRSLIADELQKQQISDLQTGVYYENSDQRL